MFFYCNLLICRRINVNSRKYWNVHSFKYFFANAELGFYPLTFFV